MKPNKYNNLFFEFFANNIEKKKNCFCILARGKNWFQQTFLTKKSYFCVLQPLLGETTKENKTDHFQLTLLNSFPRSTGF